MQDIVIEKLAFKSKQPDRDFRVEAYYLAEPKGEALVEIYKNDSPYRRFLWPAYKVWNIAAHFSDIVDGELAGNSSGYDLAGWSGFNVVKPIELPLAEPSTGTGE